MSQPTDKDLWTGIQQQKHNALKTLYYRYASHLINYGSKITTDRSLVEDVIQELFVKLWERGETLPSVSSPKAYLFSASRNNLIKALQKDQKLYSHRENEPGIEQSVEQIIIEREIDQERSLELKEAIQQLTPRQSELIYLRFHREMSYEEIVEIMDMNYQSVRNLMSRTLKSLRKKFIHKNMIFLFFCLQIEYMQQIMGLY